MGRTPKSKLILRKDTTIKLFYCGPDRIRTDDLHIANVALYQLSYGPNQETNISDVANILEFPSLARYISKLVYGLARKYSISRNFWNISQQVLIV